MKKYDYDAVVIGGGAAGMTCAKLCRGLGKRVAMIDKKRFGGDCTWTGCIPSKSLLASAKAARTLNDLKRYGLGAKNQIELDYERVFESTAEIVTKIYTETGSESFRKLGIDPYENSEAVFRDNHTILLDGKKISSDKFFITTGSSSVVPPISGIKDSAYHTNETIFSLKTMPGSMAILGGGPIGVEMATAFNGFGVKVTIIEAGPRILIREEAELTDLLSERMRAAGIDIVVGAKISAVSGKERVLITYRENHYNDQLSADIFLIAAGRRANIDKLGLENAGVLSDGKGIIVNRHLQTSAKNIYAAGDVVGPYLFSHVSNYHGIIAASNAFLPLRRTWDAGNIPWCTFTDPELARSGLTEREAEERYGRDSISVFTDRYENVDRALTDRAETGIGKFICHKNGKILGIHILGERAGELMQEAHLARTLGIPLHKLDSVIHAYPLYSDLIKSAARKAHIEKIRNNFFMKLLAKFKGVK